MDKQNEVRTPYNFIPFSEHVLYRYESEDQIPAQNVMDAKLKTGEIRFTLTAETPVFVSDGDRDHPGFFRDAQGRICIPGSSIRGLIRENMQILSFAPLRVGLDMCDRRIFFRTVAEPSKSLQGKPKEYYNTILGVQSGVGEEALTVPKLVRSGYLEKRRTGYVIIPTRDSYIRLSRKHPSLRNFQRCYAETKEVCYREQDGKVTELYPVNSSVFKKPGTKRGTLLFTGKPVNWDQQNGVYLFPEPDKRAGEIPVDKQDELDYEEDWQNRKNVLGRSSEFWKLPRKGQSKPVFYIHKNGHVRFGMSLYLRIGYPHRLAEGLPVYDRAELERQVDYPKAMLGYADRDSSRKSRVSFGDCAAEECVSEEDGFQTVLAEPKPSYFLSYVAEGKNYCDHDFRLRGYKQYWMKDAKAPIKEHSRTGVKMRPVPRESCFHGIVRYRNLTEDELGLLLWAMQLDDGCYQSIGMGKPYGYGRVKLTIDGLDEFQAEAAYTLNGLCSGMSSAGSKQVDYYIERYEHYATQLWNQGVKADEQKCESIRDTTQLKDFFYMRSTIMESSQVEYMGPSAYSDAERAMPDVAAIRTRPQKNAIELAKEWQMKLRHKK